MEVNVFLICFYCFQPVFYHPGIPRGIYRVLQWVLQWCLRCTWRVWSDLFSLGVFLEWLEDASEEVCDAGGVYVKLQNQGRWGEIWGTSGGLLTISCILAAGGGPFVRSLLDSCSMARSSCSFCIGMSGSYRGLLRTGWEGNWAIGWGKVRGKCWVCIVLCERHFQILHIIIFIYCNWVVTRWQWLFYM